MIPFNLGTGGCYRRAARHTGIFFQAVKAAVVVNVLDLPGFLDEILRIRLRFRIGDEAPGTEEGEEVLLRRGAGRLHECLVAGGGLQGEARLAGGAEIGLQTGIEQAGLLGTYAVVNLECVVVVIGQMQLPVHGEPYGRVAGGAGDHRLVHLIVHILVLRLMEGLVGLIGLGQLGEQAAGRLRLRVSCGADAAADLVGDVPAGIAAAGLFPVGLRSDGGGLEQFGHSVILHADVLVVGIHGLAGGYLVIADVQAGARVGVVVCGRPVEPLELIEVVDLLLHGRNGLFQLVRR